VIEIDTLLGVSGGAFGNEGCWGTGAPIGTVGDGPVDGLGLVGVDPVNGLVGVDPVSGLGPGVVGEGPGKGEGLEGTGLAGGLLGAGTDGGAGVPLPEEAVEPALGFLVEPVLPLGWVTPCVT